MVAMGRNAVNVEREVDAMLGGDTCVVSLSKLRLETAVSGLLNVERPLVRVFSTDCQGTRQSGSAPGVGMSVQHVFCWIVGD